MTKEQKNKIDRYMSMAPSLSDTSWGEVIELNGYKYKISSKGYIYKLPWTETQKNGKIRHKNGFILRPHIDRIGTLRTQHFVLHNLIYAHFNGDFKPQLYRIRHRDGDVFNNSVSNLVKESSQKFIFSNNNTVSEKEYLSTYYRVTKDGRIFRLSDNKELSTSNGPKGYMSIRLKAPKYSHNKDRRKTYKVHRLVAMFYLPDYSENLQVNHINGNKKDNRVENLEMVTNQENVIHAYKYLNSSYRRMMLSLKSSKPVIEMTTNRKFKSILEATIFLHVSRTSINRSLTRNVPCKNGLQFKYITKNL